MTKLQEKYKQEIIPAMRRQFGYKNDLAAPRIVKVVVNVGTGQGLRDPNFNPIVENTLARITGQKPAVRRAKKSIAGFKIRQGMAVGMCVTLRGQRMFDFIEKLVNTTLPRVKDFRGLSAQAVDRQGNLTIGFKEHIAFPEIKSDEVERIHGLAVVIHTSAKSREEGLALLKLFGFPFQDK